MAKKPEGKKKALLLVDCHVGRCQQVVELDAAEIAALVTEGVADDNDAAVAAYE